MYETPQQAEAGFYDAFQRANLEAMKAVWANDDEVFCIHPMGPRLQGREAVLASWAEIFSGGAELHFNITGEIYTGGETVSAHCVYENISYGEDFAQRSVVIATNVYRLTDAGWRICAHHGSPGRAPIITAKPPADATMH